VSRTNAVTTSVGPVRYLVDPHAFRIGDDTIAEGVGQVTTFAEQMHAMQVGQIVIAPDLTHEEVLAFLGVANSEAATIRQQGVRAALSDAGVRRIAVIEVTLRASEEEGIMGLDLMAAPLDEIGTEAMNAAEHWYESAGEGSGEDDVAEAIDRLEDAAQDLASQRVAEALLRLDEDSRKRILAYSLRADASGTRMSGMMDVIARMNPSALARLLTLVAAQASTDATRIASAMELPPEVAEQVMMLLAPSPRTEAECGVPENIDTSNLASEVEAESDTDEIDRQVSLAAPSLASGKALSTTVAVSRSRPTEESVEAIGDALPAAARDGAFSATREALRRLDEMSSDPALALAIENARGKLADPEILRDVCKAPLNDADAAIAGEILGAAGTAGADALLAYYVEADENAQSLMRPVVRGMGEPLLQVASRRMRTDDSQHAKAILAVLPMLGDRRAVAVINQGLEHLDADVRLAAVRGLADTPGDAGKQALAKALGHWDPETRRFVIREIGRVKAHEATRGLVRILEDINVFERNHELKKEAIKSLESLGSPEAIPVLRRWANRKFVFGRKNKELRFLARQATMRLEDASRQQGVDTP
jgi:HEAT repeat protein